MQNRFFFCVLLLCLGFAISSKAAEEGDPLARLGIEANDTFVFLGDSITFTCGWTQHVESYFYTRFPGTNIRFVNGAVGGDRSWTLQERFDQSVAPLKPQFAAIMLGMNDGRYKEFDAELYQRYQASMTDLLDRLEKMEADVVVMAPSHFDRQTRDAIRIETPNNYNGVLQFYGNWLRETAWDRKLPFVDVNAGMTQILQRQRRHSPQFTLTTDGIHTDATGDLVIATTLLRELNMPRLVSSISIAREEAGWESQTRRGKLSEFKAADSGVEFTFLAETLPWVVAKQAAEGYETLKLGRQLNSELLRVHGLPPGEYQLLIDDRSVGDYTSSRLSEGIELQANSLTPQYQQAKKVAELTAQRNNFMGSYAKSWFLWALRAPERAWVKEHQPGDDRYDEFNGRVLQSEEALKATPGLLKKADALIPEIYEAAQPRAHRYEIRRKE